MFLGDSLLLVITAIEVLGLTLEIDLKLDDPPLSSSSCIEISIKEGCFKDTPQIILPD